MSETRNQRLFSLQDYHWWWRAFLTSGASALYVFLYSVFYYYSRLNITKFVSGMLYMGYTTIMCLEFFLLTGALRLHPHILNCSLTPFSRNDWFLCLLFLCATDLWLCQGGLVFSRTPWPVPLQDKCTLFSKKKKKEELVWPLRVGVVVCGLKMGWWMATVVQEVAHMPPPWHHTVAESRWLASSLATTSCAYSYFRSTYAREFSYNHLLSQYKSLFLQLKWPYMARNKDLYQLRSSFYFWSSRERRSLSFLSLCWQGADWALFKTLRSCGSKVAAVWFPWTNTLIELWKVLLLRGSWRF